MGKPEGKRPLGRPRRRWENTIKMDLQEVGSGGMNWIMLAQDRGRWRALVNTVMNCQLNATEVFIADLIACSTCFGHHYAHHQELKSVIQWLLPEVFRAGVFQVAGLVWG